MKTLHMLLLLTTLCLPATLLADRREKVVEASDKRKPDWIGRSDASALSVTEVGETLAEASERCLTTIRQHIVNAVAVNISSTESMTSRQITRDDLVTVMNDYASNVTTEAAGLPYINDIALTNAEAIYWERIYNKEEKRYRYEYSVRYPFTEAMRRELVDRFLEIDRRHVAELEQLRAGLETIDDIDDVRRAVNELDGLHGYFFDAGRKRETETLRRNYLDLYHRVSIVVEEEAPGMCLYSLQLAGRRVTTSVAPRLTSDSALDLQVRPDGDRQYRLTYNPAYASPTDINRIEILYLFGGTRVAKTILFEAAERPSLQPVGSVGICQTGESLKGTLRVRVTGSLQPVRLLLRNPADGTQIEATHLTPTRLRSGELEIAFEATGTILPDRTGIATIQGRIGCTDPTDGSTSETGFTLPLKLTIK